MRFSLELERSLDSLPELREELRDWLAEADVPDDDREEIVLACWEAAANAVEHPIDADGDILVEARLHEDRILLCVADTGSWRRRDVPRTEGGLGLRLVKALMDRVNVISTLGGTRVFMSRRLSKPPGQRQREHAPSPC